jgi:hypothetical protein
MCQFCRELNYNKEWVKMETAYCQHCKKFSKKREREIEIAISKQYKEQECEKCKEKKFIQNDQKACDACKEVDDKEVLPKEDKEYGEKRISYQSEIKNCRICFSKLKVEDKNGRCFLCEQKK